MGNICARKSYWPQINCREYIGLSLEEALEKAHKNNLYTRLTSLEGERYFVNMDLAEDRLNFGVMGGKVVRCTNK